MQHGFLRSVVVALGCFVALGALCGARARAAAVEYCPVELAASPSVVDPTHVGFELISDGPRTASGSFWLMTKSGWYQADFTAVPVLAKTYHVKNAAFTYDGTTYLSAPLYVEIADASSLLAGFIVQAQATDDPTFGWDAKGMVACDPQPDARPPASTPKSQANHGVSPVGPASIVLKAQRIAAPPNLRTDCANPFAFAHQATRAIMNFNVDTGVSGRIAANVRVAVNENGGVDGAWITSSSGISDYDRAALNYANDSTYVPARAFCMAVRSYDDYYLRGSTR